MVPSDWPVARPIQTARLSLEPLRVDHAEEMAAALDDPALHEFIGGAPATVDELRRRYAVQAVGHSANGDEGWLNWVIRVQETGRAAGTVQATVRRSGPHLGAAVAWVVGSAHQRRGIASEAATAMVAWLREQGVDQIEALVHPEHRASSTVARRLGLVATGDLVDGEVRWVSAATGP